MVIRTGTFLAVISALLASFSQWAWLADLASHFRVHYALGIVLLLCIALVRHAWLASSLLLASLIIHVIPVVNQEAQTRSVSTPATTQQYTLLVTNLLALNREFSEVASRLTELDADTVAVIELTPSMQQYLQDTGHYGHYYGAARNDATGVGFFSRHPFDDTKLKDFGVPTAPAAWVVQTVAGIKVQLTAVHPLAPTTPTRYQARNRQFQHMAEYARAQVGPVVVAGDFNSSPWSAHFADLIDDSGLTANTHHWGLGGTWPTCTPLLSIPIDHVLTSNQVSITRLSSETMPGSDHCALLLELEFSE